MIAGLHESQAMKTAGVDDPADFETTMMRHIIGRWTPRSVRLMGLANFTLAPSNLLLRPPRRSDQSGPGLTISYHLGTGWMRSDLNHSPAVRPKWIMGHRLRSPACCRATLLSTSTDFARRNADESRRRMSPWQPNDSTTLTSWQLRLPCSCREFKWPVMHPHSRALKPSRAAAFALRQNGLPTQSSIFACWERVSAGHWRSKVQRH